MRANRTKKALDAGGKPVKLFFWTVLAALVFGLTGMGAPLEDGSRTIRNKLHPTEASGDIVLIEIDRETIENAGTFPWPRSQYADIINKASAAGADQIFLDVVFSGPSTPAEDAALAKAMSDAGNVTIAALEERGIKAGSTLQLPDSEFQEAADIGSINAYFNFQTAVWNLAFADEIEGKTYPTFAAKMAKVDGPVGETFPIDYSIKFSSIPTVSALDVLNGDFDPEALRGKTAILGTNVIQLGDQVFVPGHGRVGGVYVQIFAAETLKAGIPVEYGWLPAFLLAMIAFGLACLRSDPRIQIAAFLTPLGIYLVLPTATEANSIFFDIIPGMFLLVVGFGQLFYRSFKSRGLVNPLTGLPNLTALKADKDGKDLPLIAARIHNFAEIVSTLNAQGEKRFVEQVVARLSLGRSDNVKLYQGDEGIFAWFAEPRTAIGSHLEALHALFRSPIVVDEQPYDIAVSFGVEVGSSRSLASRLGSALVAADEAEDEGIKWKYHDPARQQEAAWKLSLLSQLDKAIENGEVWLAFQPQMRLKDRKIVSAEALARWTHPEKGPISPIEFIAAAEQHDRIGALTDFVIDRAVEAIAQLRQSEPDFSVAVNLSARMLSDRTLADRVVERLTHYGVPAKALVLELTETAAMEGDGADLDLLARLRDLGVQISIDDYGTGLSTLEYLKKVPASEIKVDQSFVKSMRENRSDLIMVQSTIALAHSLDRKVVAEGVEDSQVLEQLTMMKCDIAQGYAVGRPVGIAELRRRLQRDRARNVA
ncbi:EAL domain-containing protein [Sphingomicrobium clamense]|uniref:EAL domain-containing protein n=1 Tax=Sphingomicrobium clamense TaxID=2851013 RepID=A0ABS6V866_9SPHN|nr:EAL domain-containing protein [Sphingomicrobium sp. B8]MBW0145312.1 EAL domain-containing protein [Sphingomicrobium sp. B8]